MYAFKLNIQLCTYYHSYLINDPVLFLTKSMDEVPIVMSFTHSITTQLTSTVQQKMETFLTLLPKSLDFFLLICMSISKH